MARLPELRDLVRLVIQESVILDRDPLERIAVAEDVAAELGRLGDRLIGYFVEDARAQGYSWTDIGTHLGLTRQGAQQRYRSRTATLEDEEHPRSHGEPARG